MEIELAAAYGPNTTKVHVTDGTIEKETMMMKMALGLVTVLLTILFTKLWLDYVKPRIDCLRQERVLAKQGIPIVPGRSFIEGHGHLERKLKEEILTQDPNPNDPHNIVARIGPFQDLCSRLYGKMFVYWKGEEVTLHVSDPDIVKEVLATQAKDFHKNKLQKKQLKSLVGETGILFAEGNDWAQKRKLIAVAFRAEKLKKMVEPMLVSINMVLEKWEKSIEEGGGTAEIDIVQDIGLITGDILCRTSFGTTYDKGKLYFTKLMEMLACTTKLYMTIGIPGFSLLPTAENRRIWKLKSEIQELVEDLVLQTRREVAVSGGSYGDDLLGLLMEASEGLEPKYRLSNQELIDEVKTFFFAGQETTAVLLKWAMMLLATHLDWQEKLYEELESCCAGKPLDYDSVSKLRVMTMVLNEALRLYPPGIWIQRQSQKDLQLGKISVPKGVTIFLNVVAMHHDPDLWGPDASAFNPDRFADGAAKAARNPHAFIPFSVTSGPRFCVGQSFAWLEAKLSMAIILQKFKFRISPNYVHYPIDQMGPKPKHGLQILFSRR